MGSVQVTNVTHERRAKEEEPLLPFGYDVEIRESRFVKRALGVAIESIRAGIHTIGHIFRVQQGREE